MKDAPINLLPTPEGMHPSVVRKWQNYARDNILADRAGREATQEMNLAYDALDRFLRNNLDDTDYANYSAYLETLWPDTPAAPSPAVLADRSGREAYCPNCDCGYCVGMYQPAAPSPAETPAAPEYRKIGPYPPFSHDPKMYNEIMKLIGKYWDAAWKEGNENRAVDDGTASDILEQIHETLCVALAPAAPVQQELPEPDYSIPDGQGGFTKAYSAVQMLKFATHPDADLRAELASAEARYNYESKRCDQAEVALKRAEAELAEALQERNELLACAAMDQAERDCLRALLQEARERIEWLAGFWNTEGTPSITDRIDAALKDPNG